MAAKPNRDRPARNPGGVVCVRCGCIFIGEEWHTLCLLCIEAATDAIIKAQS